MKQLPPHDQTIPAITKYAQLHRAYWNYQLSIGIAKIHCPAIGVFSVVITGKTIDPIDLSDALEVRFVRSYFRTSGINLSAGFDLDKDTEVIKVSDYGEWVFYPKLNFKMHREGAIAVGDDWRPFDAPIWEYQPIKSLIGIGI